MTKRLAFRSTDRLLVCLSFLAVALGSKAGFAANSTSLSEEVDAEYSYTGGSGTHGNGYSGGSVTENSSDLKYVLAPQLTRDLLFRVGVEWQRFSFDSSLKNAPVPSLLQQVSAVVGFDYQLGDQWLVQLEVEPGIYSDFSDVRSRDIDAPVLMGGAYLANADLQWFFGLRLDVKSHYPVLPAAGVRWRFSEDWTLNFQLPHPKLEYQINPKLNAYLGAEVEANTFQMGSNYGTNLGIPKLNNTVVDYLALRLGPGIAWKCSRYATISVDSGYMPYREFEFYPHDFEMRSHGGFYGEISCTASF